MNFQAMTNLEPGLRKHLEDNFCVDYGRIETEQRSVDGTIKRLIEYGISENKAKGLVEAVLITENNRRTLCVSSQIGCSLNCTFCHTGTQKLLRNLTSGEILGQYMGYLHLLGGFPADPQNRKISNIVFMGQGEPLLNHRNVFSAIKTLTSPQGLSFPSKRITVSTSGVVPVIPRLAELGVNLAVSLHAVNDELRNQIVPLNKQFSIHTLLDACKAFVAASPPTTQRVTFEYVMLKDINDSTREARGLVRLLHGLPAHVNLIPFNPWPGCDYECSNEEQIKEFAKIVSSKNIYTTIRYSKGQDIMAACGQLKSLNMSKAKRTPTNAIQKANLA
ncbi:hypothetical protein DSO57_1028690 [Entomophthora muscae]|uniref:Uncharacterized protein n=1 Tax=Entomophthora muscae TaxID=34485 RepID=A0ACC2SE79_9FUNG|nr:hypothetical protein DSO57_1028690 [Entomophthora muscae]